MPNIKEKDIYPSWVSRYAIAMYIIALAVVSMAYSAYSLPWYYMLSGIIAVLVFFLYGSTVAQNTSVLRMREEVAFEIRLFLVAFIPRVLLMLIL